MLDYLSQSIFGLASPHDVYKGTTKLAEVLSLISDLTFYEMVLPSVGSKATLFVLFFVGGVLSLEGPGHTSPNFNDASVSCNQIVEVISSASAVFLPGKCSLILLEGSLPYGTCCNNDQVQPNSLQT